MSSDLRVLAVLAEESRGGERSYFLSPSSMNAAGATF